jgi:hypothetical protein
MPRNVINNEEARAKNEGDIRRESEDRIGKLSKALEEEPIDFDMDEVKADPDVQMQAYNKDAHAKLRAIMRKAEADRDA